MATLPLKILNVCPVYPPAFRYGGVTVTAHALAKALAARGHEVVSITTNADGAGHLDVPVDQPVWLDGVRVHYLHRDWQTLFFTGALPQVIERELGPGAVLISRGNWSCFNLAVRLVARARGVPFVLYPEGIFAPWALGHHRGRKRLWWWAVEEENYRRAAAVIALTAEEVGHVQATGVAQRVCELGNGVDAELLGELPGRAVVDACWPQLTGRQLVLYLSRLHPSKNVLALVRAFASVAPKVPDATLVLAGPEERDHRREIVALVESLGLSDRVLLPGLVSGDPKLALLGSAAAFVLPSLSEGMPISVLEALAVGCPAIISPPCQLDIVGEVGAGLVVEPTPAALAEALGALLTDPARRSKMGQSGRTLVAERFTWDRIAARMEQILAGL